MLLKSILCRQSIRPGRWSAYAVGRHLSGKPPADGEQGDDAGHDEGALLTHNENSGESCGEITSNAIQPFGTDVPRPRTMMAVPLMRRPMFPGLMYPVRLHERGVIQEFQRLLKKGAPYVGLFFRRFEPLSGASTLDVDRPLNSIQRLDQIHSVGTLGQICRLIPVLGADGELSEVQAFVLGHRRIVASELTQSTPFSLVEVEHFEEKKLEKASNADPSTIKAYKLEIMSTLKEIRSLNPVFKEQLDLFVQSVDLNDAESSGLLADIVAQLSSASGDELQKVLEAFDLTDRMQKALLLLKKELQICKMQNDISKQVEEKMTSNQRRFLLNEQLKSIKKELGLEKDDKDEVVAQFRHRLTTRSPPDQILTVIDEESRKLSHLESSSSEFNVTRNYLDWLTIMPWGIVTPEIFDVDRARTVLDQDHYGLQDVKSRILEFIAVGNLLGESPRGRIICLVGPPGVGKTSIARSIARSLDRQFFRFSVGGLTDVAEIKGHRRTYVGAMPGKLIQCLKATQTTNPVVLIDEIDKIGRGNQGDPGAALLEVLDPEQNNSFMDYYLDVPVDLSKVLFICTANSQDTIPGPLADRIEFIRLSGYIHDEKVEIANRYLSDIARKRTGVTTQQVDLQPSAIDSLIRWYCREAGVRELDKRIEQIYRKSALKLVPDRAAKIVIDSGNLSDFVGQPVFTSDRLYEEVPVGVVTGLAWTSMGGAVLYIESAVIDTVEGKGSITCTGHMGEVMRESSSIAYSVAKREFRERFPGNAFYRDTLLHMHIPEGATPKEGPSAGVTMVTSLLSLATGIPVRSDVAMTGEISLTGKVLRIGGVKEKVISARRAGLSTVLFPESNRTDYNELEENVRSGMKVYFCATYDDVYREAFRDMAPKRN